MTPNGTDPDTTTHVVMTVDDLAAYLQVGPKSLYKLAAAGKIPAVKVAGQWRFYRPTIDAWLKTLSLHNYTGPELLPDDDQVAETFEP